MSEEEKNAVEYLEMLYEDLDELNANEEFVLQDEIKFDTQKSIKILLQSLKNKNNFINYQNNFINYQNKLIKKSIPKLKIENKQKELRMLKRRIPDRDANRMRDYAIEVLSELF